MANTGLQIAIVTMALFVVIFAIGSQSNLLSLFPENEGMTRPDLPTKQPFTFWGTCDYNSDCSSTACIKWSGGDGCNDYMKWSNSDGAECISSSYCNYDTMVGCYADSSCTIPAGSGGSCSTSVKYCCGTPQTNGQCTPHAIGSNYYNVYKVNSDCSNTFVRLCNERCTIMSSGEVPGGDCPTPSCNTNYYCDGDKIMRTESDCSNTYIGTCYSSQNEICVDGQSTCGVPNDVYQGTITLSIGG